MEKTEIPLHSRGGTGKRVIRALFFDVDGTLLGLKSHKLNETDIESLQKLREKGILLFIATGRDFYVTEEMKALEPIMEFFTGIIDVNGQHVYLMDGEEISFHPIADEDSVPLRQVCDEQHLAILYRSGNENCISEMTDHVKRYWKWMGLDIPRICPMDAVIHDVPKLCIHCSPEEEARFLTPLMKHTWTARITPDLVDLIPNGIGKDSGIREICERFDIKTEETMGFGDGQNDLVMMEHVGTAVAMANASENVKAAADFVTLTTEEAGITAALKHYGLL